MNLPTRLLRSESLLGREQEFYWLWIGATSAYGVGDIVTTLVILHFDIGVRESNLLVQRLFDSFGQNGLIAFKFAIFITSLAISLYAAEQLDWELYYAPPAILIAVGTIVTAHNLRLMLL